MFLGHILSAGIDVRHNHRLSGDSYQDEPGMLSVASHDRSHYLDEVNFFDFPDLRVAVIMSSLKNISTEENNHLK